MATKYIPLSSLDQIDEGIFKEMVNKHLVAVQKELADYRRQHGPAAKGAKAKLLVEVGFTLRDPQTEAVECVSKCKYVLPAEPASVSLMMAGENQTDQPCLLVRASGSGRDEVRQSLLATRDGRTVDQNTAEVK